MDISARTQMAFDILTGLKAELPNRFDREIANARQRSTTLISDGKDWDAGNALWQLVGDIQRQIAPQYFYNARTVVAVARRLRSRGLEKLEATLTDANSALDRGDYGKNGDCARYGEGVAPDKRYGSVHQMNLAIMSMSSKPPSSSTAFTRLPSIT